MRVVLLTILTLAAAAPAPQVEVTPREIPDLLANPGMGWQTFHRFAAADENLAGLPSTSAYFRFYWSDIEPEEGHVDFAKLDGLLAQARKAGQRLAFRVMCAGTSQREMYVPVWLRRKGCPGFEYRYGGKGPQHWVPDMDHAIFLDAHFRLIESLGKRYDGHPDLDLVDIGSVGLWGEWHMSRTGVELPTLQTRLAIIDAWCRAFKKTPKVMLIGDAEGMKHAIRLGCGWRADCLGDMGGFSKTWNHMDNFYAQQIKKTGAAGAWRRGPVAFESCWDMRKWKKEGWNIRYIFDYALKFHVSYINNKSAPIPEGTRGEIERFLRRIGYRLVLKRLAHPPSVRAGSELLASMAWENAGVAPPYRDYVLAFRLQKTGARDNGKVIRTRTSIKGWKPGRTDVQETLKIPADLAPGRYTLGLAIVGRSSGKTAGDPEPAVRLAIAGRGDDGWYALSHVDVRAK